MVRNVSYNAPRLEYSSSFADPRQRFGTSEDSVDIEAFSANSLWIGKNLLEGSSVPTQGASFLRMIFHYQIQDKTSQNLLVIWVAQEKDPASPFNPNPVTVGVTVHDEEAFWMTWTIPIHKGLNILDVAEYIPWNNGSLEYPIAGWIEIEISPLSNLAGPWSPDLSWLGYSWQRGSGKASKNAKPIFSPGRSMWDVIQPADRETDDVPPF